KKPLRRLQPGITKTGKLTWRYKRVTRNSRVTLQTDPNPKTPIGAFLEHFAQDLGYRAPNADNPQPFNDEFDNLERYPDLAPLFRPARRTLAWREKMERLHQEWEVIHDELLELLLLREFERWNPSMVECDHDKVNLKVYVVSLSCKFNHF